MREHSAKKKKGLRDLKSRISLPPELKNSFSFNQINLKQINNKYNNVHHIIKQILYQLKHLIIFYINQIHHYYVSHHHN